MTSITQLFANATIPHRETVDCPCPYTGPATDPQVEALTHRGYNRRRSRIVDRWLVYADAEGFTGGGGQGVGA